MTETQSKPDLTFIFNMIYDISDLPDFYEEIILDLKNEWTQNVDNDTKNQNFIFVFQIQLLLKNVQVTYLIIF